jgi:hypothetical protein
MDSSTIKSWIIYCWRGIEDDDIDYKMKVWRIANDSEEHTSKVRLDRMQYDTGERLWDQLIDKISELEINSELNDRDSFIFIVSRNMLDKEAFSKEQAYTSRCAPNYPDKDKRLIGLMYI